MKRVIAAGLALSIPFAASACAGESHPSTTEASVEQNQGHQQLPEDIQDILTQDGSQELVTLAHSSITPDTTLQIGSKTVTFAFAGSQERDVTAEQMAGAMNYMINVARANPTVHLPYANSDGFVDVNLSVKDEAVYVIQHNTGQPSGMTIAEGKSEVVTVISAGMADGQNVYTEACQATIDVTLPTSAPAITNTLDNLVAQESFCNGVSQAYAASHSGTDYQTYVSQLSSSPAISNPNNNFSLYMPILDEAAYTAFGNGTPAVLSGQHIK